MPAWHDALVLAYPVKQRWLATITSAVKEVRCPAACLPGDLLAHIGKDIMFPVSKHTTFWLQYAWACLRYSYWHYIKTWLLCMCQVHVMQPAHCMVGKTAE